MIEITESWIDSLAPNGAAIKNGHDLVRKGKFQQLHQSQNKEVLFGTCAGSGKTPYLPSADFAIPDKPVMRCTCPSRQIPCKHVLGLLYAHVEGTVFTLADVPEDLAAKRDKAEKREEKKAKEAAEGTSSKPKKVNKSALKKKIISQLEGLDVLEKLTDTLIRRGLGTMDAKDLKVIQDHIKQMGSYYLAGAQTQLRRLYLLLAAKENLEDTYSDASEQLAIIHAFIKKGRIHLNNKLEDPDHKLDHETTIEEWLGHAWQLTELKEAGLVSEQTELLQLSFLSYDDQARQEYVDSGYWLQMDSGEIHRTIQYRPYKAAKLMREEDSFFDVAEIPLLYRYPGDMNCRVRFEEVRARPVSEQDILRIREFAAHSYPESIKKVKNQIKNPLSDPNPVLLLYVRDVCQNEDGQYTIRDESGQMLGIHDHYTEPTVSLLRYMSDDALHDAAMLVMFEHHLASGRLLAQPLSIITRKEIIRLLY